MNIEVYTTLIQQSISCSNEFDSEGMLSTLHPQIQLQNISNGEITASVSNIDEFKALAEQSAKMLQSQCHSVEKTE